MLEHILNFRLRNSKGIWPLFSRYMLFPFKIIHYKSCWIYVTIFLGISGIFQEVFSRSVNRTIWNIFFLNFKLSRNLSKWIFNKKNHSSLLGIKTQRFSGSRQIFNWNFAINQRLISPETRSWLRYVYISSTNY